MYHLVRYVVADIHRLLDSLYRTLFMTQLMIPPCIKTSTRHERQTYVRAMWECMHNCELCGKCHILRGLDAERLYADYIDGRRPYNDITLDIR